MKLTFSNRHNTPSEEAGEVFDVDVTPVMNMLVVLIPILVSMAVFSHYAIHKFYLPSNTGDAVNKSEAVFKKKATLLLDSEYLLVTVGGELLDSIVLASDTSAIAVPAAITKAKAMSDDTTKVVISVRDEVSLDKTVFFMDVCRASGFSSVGLASAPPAGDSTIEVKP